ncbi:enoyl-CoA hydratase/isomerase family protein [Tateyamaria sp. SN3-11]|uniref:enoyl-CoA hydratase/isomerase family protein n=1 Tax=Tateyamaria sp. SN3-11 TaxID=3092147 RepID=UPI0039EC09A8
MTGVVMSELVQDCLHVSLNRPDRLNAFNAELVEGLHDTMQEAASADVRAVVFRGCGKGFSGGFDLSALDEESDGDLLHRFVRVEQLLQLVAHAPFATIACTHGPCYGAAADLVAACQSRIGTSTARFRMPGAFFGLVLGTGRLSALVGADSARQLVQRSKPFGAKEAVETGFLTSIVEDDKWGAWIEDRMERVRMFDPKTYASLCARQRVDTRSADLETLVSSVTSSSIKARIQDYVSNLS